MLYEVRVQLCDELLAELVAVPLGAAGRVGRAGQAQTALALRYRIPSVGIIRAFAEAGGLMTYSFAEADMYRHAAIYVDKILKGAKPADLPIVQPTKFELAINLKTAKALGLRVPPSLLGRADQVIE